MIKTLIVDDEILTYENLKSILEKNHTQFDIIGYAKNTIEAEKIIEYDKPDLVLLDIEMPKENGIDFISRLNNINFEIIFITAYQEYAVRAFKLNALEYLLKPINEIELKNSLEKFLKFYKLKLINNTNNVKDSIGEIKTKKEFDYLKLRLNNFIELVYFNQIIYLDAKGAYTIFYVKNEKTIITYLASYNLHHYEEILPNPSFIRIHKSYIVNKKFICKVITTNNEFEVEMINGVRLPISRRRHQILKGIL